MKNSGFSLIEILIAIALVAVFIPAIATIFSLSLQSSSQGEKFSQAYTLAQEGMETAFSLKSQDTEDTDFWNDDTVSLPTLPSPFTRNVALNCGQTPDCPCLDDDGVNPHCRQVTVTVSWPERDTLEPQVKLEAYVTKH
ncbi:MAG: type II secretion system protein [bacterium]|nr:type II secretion system protein [bacterium]